MRNVTTVGFVSPENLLNVLQQDSRLLLVLTLDSTTFWNMFSKSAGIKCLVFENPAENWNDKDSKIKVELHKPRNYSKYFKNVASTYR